MSQWCQRKWVTGSSTDQEWYQAALACAETNNSLPLNERSAKNGICARFPKSEGRQPNKRVASMRNWLSLVIFPFVKSQTKWLCLVFLLLRVKLACYTQSNMVW